MIVREREVALGLGIFGVGPGQRLAQLQGLLVGMEGLGGLAEPEVYVAEPVVRDGQVASAPGVVGVGLGEFLEELQTLPVDLQGLLGLA